MNSPTLERISALFRERDFRLLFLAQACQTMGGTALAVVLGFTIYELTHEPSAIGYLGLVEAIPSLSLGLYGGHVADRHDRRSILLCTFGTLTAGAALLALSTGWSAGHTGLFAVYAIVFVVGIARGFSGPATTALEAQVVPKPMFVQGATLLSGCFMTSGVLGPLLGGYAYSVVGPTTTLFGITTMYALGWIAVTRIRPRRPVAVRGDEPIWQSVVAGAKYVWNNQVLLGSMALDLFAVLFGGAIALLPVFAKDILHVGPDRLGWLVAAPTAGALLTMLWSTRFPPVKHAGRNFFTAVAGFGVAMIVFALSTNLYLSMAMLFISGVCDGVSVVIRRSIVRLMSPDHLRGRIAAVSLIFIGSSNEIGAFESGMAAEWLGTVRSVWLGGCVTLLVVAGAWILAPKLRTLSLDPSRAAKMEPPTLEEMDMPPKPIS